MSRNIKTMVECEIHPSAEELADVFWHMYAEEQAYFFERLAEVSEGALVQQLQYVTDRPELTVRGRHVMRCIGEYAERSVTS